MRSNELNDEECDATDDDGSNTARLQTKKPPHQEGFNLFKAQLFL